MVEPGGLAVTWGLRGAVTPIPPGAADTPFGGVSGDSSLGFLREFDDAIEVVAARRFRGLGSFSLGFLASGLESVGSFFSTFILSFSFSFSRRGRRLPAEVRRGRESLASGFWSLGVSRIRSESDDEGDPSSFLVMQTVSGGSLGIIIDRDEGPIYCI